LGNAVKDFSPQKVALSLRDRFADLTGGDEPSPRDEPCVLLLRLSCLRATGPLFAASPRQNASQRCPLGLKSDPGLRRNACALGDWICRTLGPEELKEDDGRLSEEQSLPDLVPSQKTPKNREAPAIPISLADAGDVRHRNVNNFTAKPGRVRGGRWHDSGKAAADRSKSQTLLQPV
jgi:hypothetical protein